MKSVRLDSGLEGRLERAARALGKSQSEFIREAVARCCDEVLGQSLAQRLEPAIGVVQSSGGRASHTGRSFQQILKGRQRR
jgi:predicted DNA-binding protein